MGDQRLGEGRLLLMTAVVLYLGVVVDIDVNISSHRECKATWVAENYLCGDVEGGRCELTLLGTVAFVIDNG